MPSLRALLLVAAAAVAPAPGGCRTPRAYLEVERFELTRPEIVIVRCRTSGFAGRPRYSWKLPAGVHPFTLGEPVDEDARQLQIADAARGALDVECTAMNEPDSVTAHVSLGSAEVKSARVEAGLLTVDGSGFGDGHDDDAIYLVPPRGAPIPADRACKSASWADGRVIACVSQPGANNYQVRVESGGRLILGPTVKLPVK